MAGPNDKPPPGAGPGDEGDAAAADDASLDVPTVRPAGAPADAQARLSRQPTRRPPPVLPALPRPPSSPRFPAQMTPPQAPRPQPPPPPRPPADEFDDEVFARPTPVVEPPTPERFPGMVATGELELEGLQLAGAVDAPRTDPPGPDSIPVYEDDMAWGSLADGLPPPGAPASLAEEAGDALSLVDRASSRPAPPPTTGDPRKDMRDRLALNDFSGALALAERLLAAFPRDAEAARVVETCQARLRQVYYGRLGPLDGVPAVIVPRSELKWLALDHRAGFVLSLVDGVSSIEDVIDMAGMPALEVLRTLYSLVHQRVIEIRVPVRSPR